MATTVAVLEAALHADTKKFDAAMGKSESKMQKLGKVAGVAGLAIAGGLAVAFKVGLDEMIASQRVMAQTEAVIESTGGVANVTAGHVDKLSQQLLELSGVDDELITAGQNVLLTFRGIRNEAGKGNDVFDQATKAALDMSVALGMDLNSSAMMVGKALNDPIKGMTKLQRQGVTFTAGQEKLIRKLVESGDTMGAQKVILEELNTEFGGSAKAAGETLPAKLNKAKEAFADVAAALVEQLLPAFEKVADIMSRALGYLKEHPDVARVVVVGLGILAAALIAASVAATLLNLALLANPIGLVVIGVAALIVGLVLLYRKFELVRTIVDFVKDHWTLLLFAFGLLPGIIMLIVTHFGTLKARAKPVIDALKTAFDAVRTAATAVKNFVAGTLWNAIRPKLVSFKNAITDIKDAFDGVIGKVSDLIGWISDLIGWIRDIPSLPFGIGGGSAPQIYGRDGGRGGRAAGGPVTAGVPYIVGERRPELFVPNQSGTILPRVPSGVTIVVQNHGLISSPNQVVNLLRNAVAQWERSNGKAAFG